MAKAVNEHDVEAQAVANLNSQVAALAQVVLDIGDVIKSHGATLGTGGTALAEKREARTAMPDVALATFARKLYASRRERERKDILPGLFSDPAWDILLDIFIAHAQDKYISITDAGLAGQVPATTALRWVWALESAKLIERKPDSNDKRRSFVLLTDAGLKYMRQVLTAICDRMMSPAFAR